VADIDEGMTADEYLGWITYAGRKHSPKQLPKTAAGITATLAAMGIERRD